MNTRTREILDEIDGVLENGATGEGAEVARELWAVLTALRGPDSGNFAVKRAATVPIRRAAFPKTATKEFIVADFGSDSIPAQVILEPENVENWHFNTHAINAARVLELPSRINE